MTSYHCSAEFTDSMNRKKVRRFMAEAADEDALRTQITNLQAAWLALTKGAIKKITYGQTMEFVSSPQAGCNRDANISAQVEKYSGYKADFDLPMPVELLKTADARMDLTYGPLIAFFAMWQSSGVFRINAENPAAIESVIKGTVDK